MTKFNVGDRVKQIKRSHPYGKVAGDEHVGDLVGEVRVVHQDGSSFPILVNFDTLGSATWPFREDEIEPAPDVFYDRLMGIVSEITLAENFRVLVRADSEIPGGRWYFQIQCWRKDVITGEMGYGYGGKAYLSEHATDSELVQTIFGLYKGYWEHEARESFQWRGRRVFGPHIATEALWEIARRVDVRSAKHEEDQK